ncbi:phage portal protein [Sphingomonas sp. PAMC26645]|uniref:phage portal protein n=1 Tax=Sphingomonas sp. PAMC26645 TaxID=2565555 RepID=UPI001FFC1A6C|nr:phage portal protein [Sphingomonas sp. PAMC26645]
MLRRRWRRLSDRLPLPFQMQVLEPDYIDPSKHGPLAAAPGVNGGFLINGVQFTPIGTREGYWLYNGHPGSGRTTSLGSTFIPAVDIAHVFRADRPEMEHGATWLAPIVLRMKDFADFEDAQLTRQKLASAFVGVVKLRVELLRKAQADRQAAVAAMKKAQADLQAAKAAFVRTKASLPTISAVSMGSGSYSGGGGAGQAANASARFAGQQAVDQARVDLQASIDNVGTMIDAVNKFTTAIHTPDPANAKIDMNFDDPAKVKKTKKGRDTSADDEDFAAKLAEVRNAQLQADADLTESHEARYRADMDSLKADRAAYAKQLATDDRLTAAQRSTLMAEKDAEQEIRRAVIERARHTAIEQIGYDLAKAQNDAAQEVAQAQSAMADSVAGRRDAELRLLDLQHQQEEADLELILATKATASAEWANADKRKAALAGVYAMRADAIKRSNEGPADSYMRSLNLSSSAIKEQVQDIGVTALKDLNTQLSDAILGAKSLASAFANMGKRIIASLLDIAIQQAVIKPLANSLFGAADASGNRSGGFVGSIGSFLASTFGGGKAKGGGIDPSSWYVVGEKGPELFAPGVSGTVIPNGGRGAGPSSKVTITPSPYFDAVVDGRAASVAQPMAERGALSGASLAQSNMARRQNRQLGGA